MSNAAAAYYEWLALEYRNRAALFRKFGYNASAEHLDHRADGYAAAAAREASKKAAPELPDAAPLLPPTPPETRIT